MTDDSSDEQTSVALFDRGTYSIEVPASGSFATGESGGDYEIHFHTGALIAGFETTTGPADIDLQAEFANRFTGFRAATDARVLDRRPMALGEFDTPAEFGAIRFVVEAGDTLTLFVVTFRTDDSTVVSLVAATPDGLSDEQGQAVVDVLNSVRVPGGGNAPDAPSC